MYFVFYLKKKLNLPVYINNDADIFTIAAALPNLIAKLETSLTISTETYAYALSKIENMK